ncbi:MAG: ABC transporter ATP-binding protein [Alphaproteobacteria bacterium]|nr:ABC transporter ATP-binding protein [Alphaproteobacteria bacterium]
MNNSKTVIELRHVGKCYSGTNSSVLNDVSFSIKKNEFITLLGPSGSGKSTLLHIMGLLDIPTKGNIFINNQRISDIDDDQKTKLRLKKLGFVYQYHHLLQEFSAVENIMLPQLILGKNKKIAREKSEYLLSKLGLAEKINAMPSELSGGQKQRVAIARAIANDPEILLADEPTGNLDHETAMLVFEDLIKAARFNQMVAVIATHNEELSEKTDRTYYISEGYLIEKK